MTVPAEPTAGDLAEPDSLDEMIDALDDRPTPPRPPDLVLRVFEDGCAVIRSEEAPRMSYDNLT